MVTFNRLLKTIYRTHRFFILKFIMLLSQTSAIHVTDDLSPGLDPIKGVRKCFYSLALLSGFGFYRIKPWTLDSIDPV